MPQRIWGSGAVQPQVCACAEGPGLISAPRLQPGGQCSSSGDVGEGDVTAEPFVGTALVWTPAEVSVSGTTE